MSFEDAVSALEGAIDSDQGGGSPDPAPAAPAPVQQATESTTPEGSSTEGAAPAQPVDTPSLYEGTSVNPDELPEELRPLAKQLQAVFTQKTQGLAEQRKSIEALGDLDQVQEAVETYQWMQDPSNWPTMHEHLTQQMQDMGLSRADAEQAASQQMGAGPSTPDLSQLAQDPELAPLAQQVQSMQAELAAFRQEQAAQAAAMRAQEQQMAMVAEIENQARLIREANPSYKDADMDAIFDLSGMTEGNLVEAQQRYEEIKQGILSDYLTGKTEVAANPATVPLVAGETSQTPPEQPMDLDQAHKAALQHLSQFDEVEL